MSIRTAHNLNLTPDANDWAPECNYAQVAPVDPVVAQLVINADETSPDGRSNWLWFRLPTGDPIFGCFPEGETYFETELDHSRP